MNDLPARIDSEEAAIGRSSPTARRLVEASVSPNTRRAYAGALRRLDTWLDGRELDDVALAAYLAELHDAGARFLERLDGGRRGVLPREARRSAHSSRRADSPGARRVPEDRRRSGARTSAAVQRRGLGGSARDLPSAAASRPMGSPSSGGGSML